MARLTGKYPKFHETPNFLRGQLEFEKSGHTLTFVNGYYRCSQKQKSKCNIANEQDFNCGTFERRLSRMLAPLRLDEAIGRKIFYEWDREGIDLREQIEIEADPVLQAMEATILVMKQKVKKNNKISMRDSKEAAQRYGQLVKICFPHFIHSLVNNVLRSLTVIGKSYIADSWISTIGFEKVYLSNEGKILKVKPQGYFDYVFQVAEKRDPNFSRNLKFEFIDRIVFPSLNFTKVMNFFRENDYRNLSSDAPFVSLYAYSQQMDKQTDLIKSLSPDEQIRMWKTLMGQVWQAPHVFFSGIAIPYSRK